MFPKFTQVMGIRLVFDQNLRHFYQKFKYYKKLCILFSHSRLEPVKMRAVRTISQHVLLIKNDRLLFRAQRSTLVISQRTDKRTCEGQLNCNVMTVLHHTPFPVLT